MSALPWKYTARYVENRLDSNTPQMSRWIKDDVGQMKKLDSHLRML